MRIVDVCAFYSESGGGVRTYIDSKLAAAERLGKDITVVVPGKRSAVVEVSRCARIAAIECPTVPLDRRYHYFNDCTRLYRELDRWAPDHVECSSPWSSASMIARWPGGATRTLFMHSDPMAAYAYRWFGFLSPSFVDTLFSRFWRHLTAIGQSFDRIVSPSEQLASRLQGRGIRNVATIPLGVHGSFGPQLRDSRWRSDLLRSLGLAPSATLLLGVGRFSPEKRWSVVAKAVAHAARSAEVGLVLVGDGPHRERLAKLCNSLDHVRLAPQIADRLRLARLMASADALVHGCESETFGLVVAEALASGIPVLVPDRGGAFEQGSLGNGLVYRAGDWRALSDTVRQFAESRRDAMEEEAIRVAPARSMEEHFRDLFDCYHEIRSHAAGTAN